MSTARQSRTGNSSCFQSSTASSIAKRQASSSTSENIGKAAAQHVPKKRAPLADVTNTQHRPTASAAPTKRGAKTAYNAPSLLIPCSSKTVKQNNVPVICSNITDSSNSLLPAKHVNAVDGSKVSYNSKIDVAVSCSCTKTDSRMDVSPTKSNDLTVSMDESMSTYDSFKSPDVEYIDNDEISEVNSIRERTESNLFISEGNLYRQSTSSVMETDEEVVNVDANCENSRLCASIACDIYKHLRESEEKKRPSKDYMESIQRDVNASMRAILIDWLVEVAEEYRLVPDTLFLAVNYIDRYLSGNVMNRQKLQLLGVACMMIAAKYEEICAPQVEEFCYITDNTYFREEVLEMESAVLNYLKFELTAPTAKCFLRRFVRVAQGGNEVPMIMFECLANYIIELSLLEYNMLAYAPSLIAASAIFVSKFILLPSKKPWNQTLQHYTQYRPSDLQGCVKQLHRLCMGTNVSLSAIREKYSQHKYKFVAKRYCPPTIPLEFFRDRM